MATKKLKLFDAHCHLELMADATSVADEAQRLGLGLFDATVMPRVYDEALPDLTWYDNVYPALGMHPWYIEDEDLWPLDVMQFEDLAPKTRFIGEVGLDFSSKHTDGEKKNVQLKAFTRVCETCAETSDPAAPKVLSIHAVKAADEVLDVLEETGALKSCRCVFHWFSGSSPELKRAIDAGCWFSFGERSMDTKRGREYARQVPADHLLTETDYPPEEGWDGGAADVAASLERTLAAIKTVRDEDVRSLVMENALTLLS